MKDYGVVIPVYTNETNLWMVDRCIEMLDIDPRRVLLVDNTPENLCKKYEDKEFNISYHPENLGVARSWNLGIKLGHDWTFIVGCTMRFPEGFSAIVKMLETFDGDKIFRTPQGWHCNAISKKLIEEIGYFDENFYPAYMEDSDFQRRMVLAGINQGGYQDVPAYCQKTSQAMEVGLKTNPKRSTAYWIKKWGGDGDPNYPEFTKPFGDKPLDYWPKRTIQEITNEEVGCDLE